MAKLKVSTKNVLFPVAKDLYGLFFEDINRAGDGGLYPEMIRNRAFEDSIPPEEVTVDEDLYSFTSDYGWKAIFNHGEGLTKWIRQNHTEYTPIPAWYAENGAEMHMNRSDPLNGKRLAALDIAFNGGVVYNIGYAGIPQEKGKTYHLDLFAKPLTGDGNITVTVEDREGKVFCKQEIRLTAPEYARYEAVLSPVTDGFECRLCLRGSGSIRVGFVSLMPTDTCHGLRKDLVELYRGIHPRFVRFPGGCIVEGFTFGTMNRFKNSLGPAWERPSQYLLWHYRTTNGLGFHEFLQLCEDLGAEPLYVCNCGLICQGRSRGKNYLEGEELKELLEDTIAAIEYATAPADTEYGKLRAAAGHPAPFKMNYLEIGNENGGPLYLERYEYFRKELKKRFPHMTFVANTHVERDGLEADIVDEHFYSDVHFFSEHLHHYDQYDRKGPGIFVGEVAVNVADTGNLRAAVSEAMFFIGMERNQDVVKLASYAPMMENIHFAAWAPNLIAFDNHRSYGIPSYYIWKLFGSHRGDKVVGIEEETARVFRPSAGMPSIVAGAGLRFKNPVYNGKPALPSHCVLGYVQETGEGFTVLPGDENQVHPRFLERLGDRCLITLGDDEASTRGVFRAEVLPRPGKAVGIGIFSARWERSWYDKSEEQEQKEWDFRFVHPYQWIIGNGVSRILDTGYQPHSDLCAPVEVTLPETEYVTLGYEADEKEIRVFINGSLIQTAALPSRQQTAAVATVTDSEVIVKVVNFAPEKENVRIMLDCKVESGYTLSCLRGDGYGINTIEDRTNISDETLSCTGASEDFVFGAAPYSVNVLTLKKQ